MSDNGHTGRDFGAAKIQSFVNHVLDIALDRMRAAAREGDGRLRIDEIEDTIRRLKETPGEATMEFYHRAWEDCCHVVENARWDRERRYPFERLVVRRFVHLLPERGRSPEPGKQLSRQIIPGFIRALQQLLGPEPYERYEAMCRDLVQKLRATYGDGFNWDYVYGDPTSETIVNDVLVQASEHFVDMERRRNWMIDIIDGDIPAPRGGEPRWLFREREFHMLMSALFKPLRDALDTREGTERLRQRYGIEKCALLRQVFEALDRDYSRIAARQPQE